MASLHTLERRIVALEARLAKLEGGYGNTLYKLHRASVKTDLRMAKLLDHLKIDDVSDDEVDPGRLEIISLGVESESGLRGQCRARATSRSLYVAVCSEK